MLDRAVEQKYRFDAGSGFYLSGQKKPTISTEEIDFGQVPPLLRALLVTDGTVTKFLEAYLWEPIRVEKLFQEDSPIEQDLPWLDLKAGDVVLKRRVILRGLFTNRVYTLAESIVRVDRLWDGLREDLLSGRLGMGELLRDRRMETYREVLTVNRERGDQWAGPLELQAQTSVLRRHYRIFTQQRPTILIMEVFPEERFIEVMQEAHRR